MAKFDIFISYRREGGLTTAFENYLRSARLGSRNVQLQRVYSYKFDLGTKVDLLESRKWFEKAVPEAVKLRRFMWND